MNDRLFLPIVESARSAISNSRDARLFTRSFSILSVLLISVAYIESQYTPRKPPRRPPGGQTSFVENAKIMANVTPMSSLLQA